VLRVTDFGEIRFELLADVAPETAANFVRLAEKGFYDGTTFHRVIPGFMIQGGDPNTRNRDPRDDGRGRADPLRDEFSAIGHRRGIVSMANSGRANSASCQFFIVVGDQPDLDGRYAVFGNVIAGMDVVDRIVAMPRDVYGRHGPPDRPLANVVVESVRIERSASAEKTASDAVAPAETRG
jgi:cyclophilin family peptidyl-prolyl cis-trans isomerase